MRWQDMEDGKEKYSAYLCSREWGVKREAVTKRAGGVCERCKWNAIDAVHHLTYERKYKEEIGDLQGLCRACHEFTHGRSDFDPSFVGRRITKKIFEALPAFSRDVLLLCVANPSIMEELSLHISPNHLSEAGMEIFWSWVRANAVVTDGPHAELIASLKEEAKAYEQVDCRRWLNDLIETAERLSSDAESRARLEAARHDEAVAMQLLTEYRDKSRARRLAASKRND